MKKLSLDDETESDLRDGLSKGKRDDLSDADRAAINRFRPNSIWAEDCSKYPGCKCDDICLDSGGSPAPLPPAERTAAEKTEGGQ